MNVLDPLKKKLNSRAVNILVSISLLTLLFPGISILSLDQGNIVISKFFYKEIISNPKLELPPSIFRLDTIGQVILLILSTLIVTKKEILTNTLLIFFSFCVTSIGIFFNESFSLTLHLKGLIQLSIVIFIFSSLDKIYQKLDIKNLVIQLKFINFISVLVVIYAIYQFIIFNFFCNMPECSNGSLFYFNNPSLLGYSAIHYDNGVFRATSIFKEPSHLSYFLFCVFFINYQISKKNFLQDLYLYQTLLILLIGLLIARGGYIILLLICFFTYEIFIARAVQRKNAIKIIILLVISFAQRLYNIAQSFLEILNQKSSFLADASLEYRFQKIKIGFEIMKENFFGIGFGNLPIYTSIHDYSSSGQYKSVLYFLNSWLLQIIVEGGLIGTFIILFVMRSIFKGALKDKESKVLLLLLVAYQDLPLISPLVIFSTILMFLYIYLIDTHKNFFLTK